MKLHYNGTYNLDPNSLPHGEHQPGAIKFKEFEDSEKLSVVASVVGIIIMATMAVPAVFRIIPYADPSTVIQLFIGALLSVAIMFPHELLHAICFREDVYLYTNIKQGMLFVIGPEAMSKSRFIIMSLLPNIVFGWAPYILGMIFPKLSFLLVLGSLATGMGSGDYYNVKNAVTQMPRGAKTYLYGFNSYWYIPQKKSGIS